MKHSNRETVTMKNITVSVDDETYRRSRVKAAEAGTSVSALVRSFLIALGQGDSDFDRLHRLQQATLEQIRARQAGLRAADNLSRDALHTRDALR